MTVFSTRRTRAAAGTLAITAALALAGCGDDEETTSEASTTSEATSTTETSTTETTDETTADPSGSGGFADAAAALEADGFDVEDKEPGDLEAAFGTATAGAVLTRPGSSGDILMYEWSDPKEAADYAKGNTDDVLTTEAIGTLTLSSTTNNTDLLDQAVAALP